MFSLLSSELDKQGVDLNEARSGCLWITRHLENLDYLVWRILRDKARSKTDLDESRIHTQWTDSYRNIEKVLEAMLLSHNIKVKLSPYEPGKHSYHLDLLTTFDDENNPLNEALGRHSCPGSSTKITPQGRENINSLRKIRNTSVSSLTSGRKGPASGYREFYVPIFADLIKALKVCKECHTLRDYYCNQATFNLSFPGDLTEHRCRVGQTCAIRFKNYAEWRIHAKLCHPTIFETHEIQDARLQYPDPIHAPANEKVSEETIKVPSPEVSDELATSLDSVRTTPTASESYGADFAAFQSKGQHDAQKRAVVVSETESLEEKIERLEFEKTAYYQRMKIVMAENTSLKEEVHMLQERVVVLKQESENMRSQKDSVAKDCEELKKVLEQTARQKAAAVTEAEKVGARTMLRQIKSAVTAAGEDYFDT